MNNDPSAHHSPPMMVPVAKPTDDYPTEGKVYNPMQSPPPTAPAMYNDPGKVSGTNEMGLVMMNDNRLKVLHHFNPVYVTCNSCKESSMTTIKTNASPQQWIFCCMLAFLGC